MTYLSFETFIWTNPPINYSQDAELGLRGARAKIFNIPSNGGMFLQEPSTPRFV